MRLCSGSNPYVLKAVGEKCEMDKEVSNGENETTTLALPILVTEGHRNDPRKEQNIAYPLDNIRQRLVAVKPLYQKEFERFIAGFVKADEGIIEAGACHWIATQAVAPGATMRHLITLEEEEDDYKPLGRAFVHAMLVELTSHPFLGCAQGLDFLHQHGIRHVN
ncbi:hypothetical protein K469DRAFT_683786 [Zopfia rhizophila CBS 207.26]|uniref:Uncharacterized protein n=1 Tax=Zopfia rhizophila CBS 207.26 TaxID=1314779 RepID=A0A6A6EEC6_9PEZI|nr:hypothetical protein K469DRAFT_683786 [Zopfia rhizophila CBS 207.26]